MAQGSHESGPMVDTEAAVLTWRELYVRVKHFGGIDEDVYRLLNQEGAGSVDLLAHHLVRMGVIWRNRYRVKVNHDSLAAAIAAARYSVINGHITAENFHLHGRVVIDADLFVYPPKCNIGTKGVILELGQMGLQPADLPHLCAFAEQFSVLTRRNPVVALGSVYESFSGNSYVPVVGGWSCGRWLELRYWDVEWDAYYSFLAIRKTAES